MAGVSKGTAKQAEENRYAEKKWKEEQHELERRQRKRRETAIAGLAQYGGIPLLKITRHFLKKQGRREKEALLHWQVQQRLQKRLPRFKYRLGKRTPYLADLWRFCKRIAPGAEVRQCKFPRGSTLASPYAAHQKMVRKRFPEKMDESRLDAANVLHMRCTGYTPQDVANALYRHIPVRPKNKTMTKG